MKRLSLLVLFLLASCATAPTAPPGYLSQPLDAVALLPGPPPIDSAAGKADKAAFDALQADGPRFDQAATDANSYESEPILQRFAPALGVKLNSQNAPALVHLLDRAEIDARNAVGPAKQHFNRTRPFQQYHLATFCSSHIDPSRVGDSYPSGHATRGWYVALILAQVAPTHETALLARGADYGDSRVVCRVHYPSDVEAGRFIAAVLVQKWLETPAFQADLDDAKAEYKAASRQ